METILNRLLPPNHCYPRTVMVPNAKTSGITAKQSAMLGNLTGSPWPVAVHQCARFTNDPRLSYERVVKRIIVYLLCTRDRGTKGIECFVDADFAGRLITWFRCRLTAWFRRWFRGWFTTRLRWRITAWFGGWFRGWFSTWFRWRLAAWLHLPVTSTIIWMWWVLSPPRRKYKAAAEYFL